MAHYEAMDYQPTAAEPEDTEMCCMIAAELAPDAEMCCMIAAELAPDAEMSEARVYRPAEESEDEDEIPPPPTMIRQNAVTGPHGGAESLREQELRYIAEHGLVDFCHGMIVTAILQDPDYLLAQLTYLRR